MRKGFDNFLLFLLIILVLPTLSVGKTVNRAHRRGWLPRTLLGWSIILVALTLLFMGIRQTSWWQGHDQVPVQSHRVSQPSTAL